MKPQRKTMSLLLFVLLLGLTQQAFCPKRADSNDVSTWKNATNQELDEVRGGFITDQGLPIAFGYNETATINGVTVMNRTFNLQNPPTPDDLHTLIQSGTENVFGKGSAIGSSGKDLAMVTAIQNTLNNKIITHNTTINATVTNLNLFRNMNLSSSLKHLMVNGMR